MVISRGLVGLRNVNGISRRLRGVLGRFRQLQGISGGSWGYRNVQAVLSDFKVVSACSRSQVNLGAFPGVLDITREFRIVWFGGCLGCFIV